MAQRISRENFLSQLSQLLRSFLWLICCLGEPFATLRLSFSMYLFQPAFRNTLFCSYTEKNKSKTIHYNIDQHSNTIWVGVSIRKFSTILLECFESKYKGSKHCRRNLEGVLVKTQLLKLFPQNPEGVPTIRKYFAIQAKKQQTLNFVSWIWEGIIEFIVNILWIFNFIWAQQPGKSWTGKKCLSCNPFFSLITWTWWTCLAAQRLCHRNKGRPSILWWEKRIMVVRL